MDRVRESFGTPEVLATIQGAMFLVAVLVTLLILAFGPPNVSKTARVYYQASVAGIIFRAWYATAFDEPVSWWGNLLWLNWLVASVVLLGAILGAGHRTRQEDGYDGLDRRIGPPDRRGRTSA
jgi:hypothetical protein